MRVDLKVHPTYCNGLSTEGRRCGLAVVVVCLGISGCTNLDLRGDRFADNELSNTARQMRAAAADAPSDAFSNKARQIDRSLGGARQVTPGDSAW